MVTAVAVFEPSVETLTDMIDAAGAVLRNARTSAEVLEARTRAAAAYDVASRLTRRKAAYDHVRASVLRLQAQALRIEARAKERLADEYDAAQERGEVRTQADNQHVVGDNKLSTADLGLRRDEIHEARRLRDVERSDPGAIDRAIDARAAMGEPPTRAALKRDLGIAPSPAAPQGPRDYRAISRWMMGEVAILLKHEFFGIENAEPWELDLAAETVRAMPEDKIELFRRAHTTLGVILEKVDHVVARRLHEGPEIG